MTPEQAAVIEAARAMVRVNAYNIITSDRTGMDLAAAVEALNAAEADPDRPRPWRLVVADDEVFSEKTGKWFKVLEIKTTDGIVKVRFTGIPKVFEKSPEEMARVHRSAMGGAVDVLNSVVWSGPS